MRHPKLAPNLLQELGLLLRLLLLLEWRSRAALGGLALYVATSVFVTAITLQGNTTPAVWNVVYWLLVSFAAFTAAGRSFVDEAAGLQRYYYQLASPIAWFIAKLLYQVALLLCTALLALLIYLLLLGSPLVAPGYYLVAVVLGVTALASTLTLIAAVAAKAQQAATLLPVLGFPVVLPVLLTAVKLAAGAMAGIWLGKDASMLAALTALAVATSLLLYPYLQRE